MIATSGRRLDCCGRTACDDERMDGPDRYLIGHLGNSPLVRDSNTAFGANARLLGGSQGHLLMVAESIAEGVEEPTGEAAEIALDVVSQRFAVPSFFGVDVEHEDQLRAEFEAVVASAQRAVVAAGRRSGDAVPGTTLTAAYLLWPRLYLAHLGDGRCYVIRDGRTSQLTTDHVRRVRTSGDAHPGALRRDGALLTNALGAGVARPAVEFSKVELADEDTVVLCTAGAVERLGDEQVLGEAARLGGRRGRRAHRGHAPQRGPARRDRRRGALHARGARRAARRRPSRAGDGEPVNPSSPSPGRPDGP